MPNPDIQPGHNSATPVKCDTREDQGRLLVEYAGGPDAGAPHRDSSRARSCGRRVENGHAGLFVDFDFPGWQVAHTYSSLLPRAGGLYDPRFEHDACGVGFVARLSGTPGHDIVAKAVEAVANLSHRGAVAADGKSGDGSGVLTQIPRKLLAREATKLGVALTENDPFGVGMFFLPDMGGEACVE